MSGVSGRVSLRSVSVAVVVALSAGAAGCMTQEDVGTPLEAVDEDAAVLMLPRELGVNEERFVPESSEMQVVVFEETEPPVVHRRLRVPQTDADSRGALFNISLGSPLHLKRLAGSIMDLCVFDDAFFAAYSHFPDSRFGEPTRSQRAEMNRYRAGLDCRGQAALERPLHGYEPNRWFYLGPDGLQSPYFATREEAVEAYEAEAAAIEQQYSDTLPEGTDAAGFRVSDSRVEAYLIAYSPADAPVDEVKVLPGSVTVADGTLRGLVRNWSRDMWAYGVSVHAGRHSWSWPLSMQPGEVAPFEINRWGGPADPALIDFDITAEMSNDSDLSRSFAFLPVFESAYGPLKGFEGHVPPEVFDGLLDQVPAVADTAVEVTARWAEPDSHPSMSGSLQPELITDLHVYVTLISDDGGVVDVMPITPYHSGHNLAAPEDGVLPPGAVPHASVEGTVHYPPFVLRQYPHAEHGHIDAELMFAVWPRWGWLLWIGGALPLDA